MGPLNGTGRPIRLLKADEVGRRVFNWGIVSRFAEPSQGWDLLLPHATFVGSSEFASSGQARLLALLAGPMVLGISARPLHGAHRERPPSTPRFPRWVLLGGRCTAADRKSVVWVFGGASCSKR